MNVFNIDTAKSYATEANLIAGLKRLQLADGSDEDRFIVVRNRAGRYTAIFPFSDGVAPAHCGFKVFG
jgi:hypothetical protein